MLHSSPVLDPDVSVSAGQVNPDACLPGKHFFHFTAGGVWGMFLVLPKTP